MTQVKHTPGFVQAAFIRRAYRRAIIEQKQHKVIGRVNRRFIVPRHKKKKLTPEAIEKIEAFRKRHGILLQQPAKRPYIHKAELSNSDMKRLMASKTGKVAGRSKKVTLPKLKFLDKSD